MLIKKLDYKIDYQSIRNEVDWLLDKFPLSQLCLTHTNNTVADSLEIRIQEGIGSLYDFQINEFRYRETDFRNFIEEFKHTSLFKLYQEIPYIGRFRIMVLDGPKCYTIHRDFTLRYHYVLETNPDCLFLFPELNQQLHIPCDGNLYLLDTRYRHTFVNGSKKRRIHLVMDDLSTLL